MNDLYSYDQIVDLMDKCKTSFTYDEASFLSKKCMYKKVLELGSYTGFSTLMASLSGTKVTSIDNYSWYDHNDFTSIEEVKKIRQEMIALCENNVTIVEMDIHTWFMGSNCPFGYYDIAIVDSGDNRSLDIGWCINAGIKELLIHDFKFENIIYPDGELDWRGDIIYGVWRHINGVQKIEIKDTLLYLDFRIDLDEV